MSDFGTIFAGNSALALFAALTWGGGDFSGGLAVKHAGGSLPSALRVILLTHGVSLCFLAAIALARHDSFPNLAAVSWGLTAGLLGGLSVTTFYICLARGAMGASAAISGLLAAAIPALVSAALEGAPGLTRVLGFALAAIAIWLIAASGSSPSAPVPSSLLLLSILSGAGFGLYFVALRMAGSAGVLWPMALSRCGSIGTCAVGLLLLPAAHAERPARPAFVRSAILWALAASVLDTAGNLFFIAATRAGRLDVAAVLASLYPATTILLAIWLLRERATLRQGLGMLLALGAVVLITL